MAENLLEIQNPMDFTSRPRFKEIVDPKVSPFKRVIKHYHLRAPIPCSISSCRQPHNEGFLVELVNGDETNIGHVCGRRYFGDSFLKGVEDYRREQLIPELQRKLVASKGYIESSLQKINEFCELESSGLGRMDRSFRRLMPKLSKLLSLRASRGQFNVMQSRQRSKEEIDRLVAMNPSVPRAQHYYEETVIGEIQGLRSFNGNLYELLHVRLKGPLEELLQSNFYAMAFGKLVSADSLLRSLDEVLSQVGQILKDKQAFFAEKNFQLLSKLEVSADELKLLNFDFFKGRAAEDPRGPVSVVKAKPMNRRERRKLIAGMDFESRLKFKKSLADSRGDE